MQEASQINPELDDRTARSVPVRLSGAVCAWQPESDADADAAHDTAPLIGLLPGEGIGPDLTESARVVLDAASRAGALFLPLLEHGGPIGDEAIRESGCALSGEIIEFCASIFQRGGSILAGPGGDRFVYDLRREFGLFCKLNPVRPMPELAGVCHLKPEALDGVDLLVLREGVGGLYEGDAESSEKEGHGVVVSYHFDYSDVVVRRFLAAAAAVAKLRKNKLAIVTKASGMPSMSRQWRGIADEIGREEQVEVRHLDIDLASYLVVQEAREFDVIAAPNCFGDILSDLGGIIMGNRSLTYGAAFSPEGAAVYQTNHGAAHDLAGSDTANPVGHLLSLSFMLHESFGLTEAAARIESGIRQVLAVGTRTADIAEPGHEIVGTREFTDRVAQAVAAGVD